MRTNIRIIETREGNFWGTEAGVYEYGDCWTETTECCDAYNLVGIGIVGIELDGSIMRDGSLYCGINPSADVLHKRGRHSHSSNKQALRRARIQKILEEEAKYTLPF